jgi:hypothetical protein
MNSQERKWFKRLHDEKTNDAKVFMKSEYRRWWTAVIDKYPDSAHFIYELLQNADDAKATIAEIHLMQTGVLFKHNGSIRFTVSNPDNYEEDIVKGNLGHLNSITSIGMSTKNEDSTDNKIGKFGVGFKAVFQFTKTPEIYDDNVCFRLRDYIIPELIEHDHSWRKKGETLFFIPFDSEKMPAQKAYTIIESKLKTLNSPILFLNHLKEISWSSDDNDVKGYYRKDVEEQTKINDILCENIIIKSLSDSLTENNLWLFTRDVVVEDRSYAISIGYYINDKGKVDVQRRPKIFCYFPTSESLDACFVMHAPFALVDNRQQIKRDEEVNAFLFKKLSILAADALTCLCELSKKHKKQWIDENIFDIVPLEKSFGDDDKNHEIWFNFFYDSFQATLSNKAVHLSTGKKYVTTENALKVEEPIRQLLTIEQFNKLLGNRNLSYVHTRLKITEKIEDYFLDIGLDIFTVDEFGTLFSEPFIAAQDEEWLMKFYRFLLLEPARKLIEKYKVNYRLTSAQLLTKPFIRNSKKKFVAPFTSSGKPNVFISDGTTQIDGINYVDPELAADANFQTLLKKINITVPDGRNYVESAILPRYAGSGCLYDDTQYKKDFKFIFEVYQKCNAQDSESYLALVKELFKFKCTNNHFHLIKDVIYEKNEQILSTGNIVDYLHILDRDYYRAIKGIKEGFSDSFLNRFDFSHFLKVIETHELDRDEFLKRISENQWYLYGSPNYTDYRLDTFDECCKKKNITEDYSVFVWDSLSHQAKTINDKYLDGNCSYQPYNDARYNPRTRSFESSLSISIKRNKWLYNKNGQLCSPDKIFIEDLSSRYTISQAMIDLIGLKHTPQTQDEKFIEENCSKATLDATRIGRMAQDAGITSQDEMAELIALRNERRKREEENLRAIEKRKQDEEDRKKIQMLQSNQREVLFTHKQKKYSVDETFDRTATSTPSKLQSPETPSPIDFDEQLKQRQEKEKEQEEEKKRLQQIANDESKRYTYEWFLTMLELEFIASGEANRDKRGIEINFSRVEKDPYSEHGVLLKNPSRHIPIAIEEMNNIAVTFRLPEDTHQTIVFEVASVQDYVLRLKCKNEDIKTVDTLMSLSRKIYRAELKTATPVQLIAKLQEAFFDLQLPDEYSMLENINPTIKFIFGPPGTGKTTHLVIKWINQIAIKPRGKMLILCPTNKAADVIAKRAFALIDKRSRPDNWLFRFVATNEDELARHVCMRESSIWEAEKCCVISTIARFSYDGFDDAKLKDIDWDYIVIDEASMIPLAQIVYPIYKCTSAQIVIAGDPMQIEPIVHEDLWKDENIYKMIHLENFKDPETRPVQFDIVNLPTQYRAVPAIGDLYSKYAYGGGVASDRKQSSQQKISLGSYSVKSVNFVTFPVERSQSIYCAQQIGTSNVQVYAALFTFEFTKYIAKNLIAKDDGQLWRIGIVSPYHAQAEVINKLWEQREETIPHVEVTIGTVHGFQGDECDIIIAVYNPPASGMVRASDRTFINRKNILNVAISRAQDYLFLLMPDKDYEHFDKLQAKNIGVIASQNKKELTLRTAQEVEKYMFGDSNHIEKNTFVTTHQQANVYTAPTSKYEVRIDEKSIDIQIKDSQHPIII